MVGKKYLCTAPRPENWEEKAQALLRSFQGDREKRDETLRQTLQQLKALRYVSPFLTRRRTHLFVFCLFSISLSLSHTHAHIHLLLS